MSDTSKAVGPLTINPGRSRCAERATARQKSDWLPFGGKAVGPETSKKSVVELRNSLADNRSIVQAALMQYLAYVGLTGADPVLRVGSCNINYSFV